MVFKPKNEDRKTRMYQLRMTEKMFVQIQTYAKLYKLPKQELIRQLLEFGFANLESPEEIHKSAKMKKVS
jgi:hypothetical protein